MEICKNRISKKDEKSLEEHMKEKKARKISVLKWHTSSERASAHTLTATSK